MVLLYWKILKYHKDLIELDKTWAKIHQKPPKIPISETCQENEWQEYWRNALPSNL